MPDKKDNNFERREAVVSGHVLPHSTFYWEAEKKREHLSLLGQFVYLRMIDVMFT